MIGGRGRREGGFSEVSGRTFPFYRETEVGKMTIDYLLPLSLSATSLTFKKKGRIVRLMLTTLDLWKGRGRRHDVFLHWKFKSRSLDSVIDIDRCRGHNLCLRFLKKVGSFTPFVRRSGFRSVWAFDRLARVDAHLWFSVSCRFYLLSKSFRDVAILVTLFQVLEGLKVCLNVKKEYDTNSIIFCFKI
jgi:hypothetical protein